ncbi:MAG: YCF48-related protein [Candidatus Sulfotelmatobacter sp.]
MQGVPQFVLKHLREKAAAGAHPDPDLLTAFAEQSLLEGERARVMEHLAACGDCRDVLALALPETEIEVSPVSVTPVRTGWLGLPILRWGALAAGLAAVISVGVLQYSHSRKGDMVASNPAQEAATLPSASAHPAQLAVSQTEAGNQASSMLGYQASTGQKLAVEVGRTGRSAGHEVVFAQRAQSANALTAHSNPTAAASHAKKPPVTSELLEAQKSSAVNSESAAISQNQVAQNESPLPLEGGNATNLTSFDVIKAKDPVPAQAASSNAPTSRASATPLQTSPSLMLRALPRWTVSSSGVLQRSFDGGNTWENVNPSLSEAQAINHRATPTAEADVTNSTHANNQKAAVAVDPGPVFRAVAAFGAEVWAGGGGGVLYHTSDSGNHWLRITPSTAEAGLTGDIVGIQFSDPQHGKVSTSNAELWTTSDTGQTWQKQQ